MQLTLTLWPVKDFGDTNLSTDTKIDAGDELRIPLKPLLAIACVCVLHEQERTLTASYQKKCKNAKLF